MKLFSIHVSHIQRRKHLSSFQTILIGFMLVILIGALLLMLPFASRSGRWTPFSDTLFTATSAACVTGLVVRDTATHWSAFGQIIVLILIQIGGLGVITATMTIAMITGKKIGLVQRSTMKDSISAPQMGGIVRLTTFILKITAAIELIGALALAFAFCPELGIPKGIWYSLFHSVSAFCNAGFDLMGIKSPFSSLTSYNTQPLVNGVIMLLIITGGIGFLTWDDIRTKKWHFHKYRMQSKIILTVSAALILFPALYFFFGEYAHDGLPLGERFLNSLFQAVTPRTAGFNTTDLSAMSEAGQMIMILLMLVGGSPGSTAGGMKTTTLAVLLIAAVSIFRRRESVNCFGRRISPEAVVQAATILVMYLVLFLTGGICISILEQQPMMICLFESASAIGTVGLSLGLTPQLCQLSRAILIVMMFLGRVGGLTVIYAALSGNRAHPTKYPLEKITVG